MPPRCIEAANGPVRAEFRAIPSKSETHRALVAGAMADGETTIVGPLDSPDTRRTRDGLSAMGTAIRISDDSWVVRGLGGRIPGGAVVELGESGTSARFLTAVAALGEQPSTLDGSSRLRERPMDELVGALRALGASLAAREGAGLPLRAGGQAVRGGTVELPAGRSSQFASALLLAAPAFERGVRLVLRPPLVSRGYLAMTLAMLESFGAIVERHGEHEIVVPRQRLVPCRRGIAGDHSAASYLFAAAAIVGGTVRVTGLARASLQPDARFLADLERIGCAISERDGAIAVRGSGRIPPFSWDLRDAPDLAPTACAVALNAEGSCRLTGLGHLRLKESDRLAQLATNAIRMGAGATIRGDALLIEPAGEGRVADASIDVVNDHRIAMAFAVAGLRRGGVTLSDAGVVAKSYPTFWVDFERLTS